MLEPSLEERVVDLLRRERRALCASCVGALLGAPHLTARDALESLVLSDALAYREVCQRCGARESVVGLRAA